MDAYVHIILSIEKQISSVFRNHLPFINCSSQIRDMEKTFTSISISITCHFYALLLVNKGILFIFVIVIWVAVGESQ